VDDVHLRHPQIIQKIHIDSSSWLFHTIVFFGRRFVKHFFINSSHHISLRRKFVNKFTGTKQLCTILKWRWDEFIKTICFEDFFATKFFFFLAFFQLFFWNHFKAMNIIMISSDWLCCNFIRGDRTFWILTQEGSQKFKGVL